MPYDTIITYHEVARHLEDPAWVYVDCRANMADREFGHRVYCQAHLPRAVYAGLDDDLSGPAVPGSTGRHPLPSREQLIALFARLGIGTTSQVVVYDEQAGQMAAARLWWLLKWAGHEAVAVIDGGFQQWQALGLPTESGEHHNPPATFTARFQDRLLATANDVTAMLGDPAVVIVDSRAADRYRGENEIIDPVAGHIPGAVSAPFVETIATDGTLKPPLLLKEHFRLRGICAERQPVFYCGSGVTAAQNILAYVRAGLGMPRLYAGSWSDWIMDPARPVATGNEPGNTNGKHGCTRTA
jgi:thiosulfate/3-mercaptopyruvate sulfurtransferase